ncbi:M23 family metallopeptidase [Candidatus Gracilibacteria bacterium]|nr:M23 family metallopeptidase [Candidatus Gracilibacteria bacterium]
MKKVLISVFIILSMLSGIGLAYSAYINFSKKINFVDKSGKKIFVDVKGLDSVILSFKSNKDISKAYIHTNCESESTFITQEEDIYFFKFTLSDQHCQNPNFSLKQGDEVFINTHFKLEFEKKSQLYSLILDYSSQDIVKTQIALSEKIKNYSQYKKLKESSGSSFMYQLQKQRIYQQLVYKNNLLDQVITKRQDKYSIPVKGFEISDGLNVIPNADRSYRKDYTDGIHHGWDIMAPQGTPVSAIDDGIIIRVVRDFEYEDISNIKRTPPITHSEKLRNLDILRGNQVWLKTMKGDVIFYSHLDDVYSNIEEGIFLKEGTDIGTIGVTGVPDRDYDNFHLHFPIQKNPYNPKKAGKYSLEDIMDWDWYLKGLDATSVVNGKGDIFKSHENHDH